MRELTCIGCPMGCALTVRQEGEALVIAGNACPRGEKYARSEFTHPMRMLSSTVAIDAGEIPRLPVKTAREIPRERVMACMAEIQRAHPRAPVRMGDIIIHDCAGTGVDVVATRNIRAVAK